MKTRQYNEIMNHFRFSVLRSIKNKMKAELKRKPNIVKNQMINQ